MKLKYLILSLILILGIISIKYFTFTPFAVESGHYNEGEDFTNNQVIITFKEDISFTRIKWFLININGKLDADKENDINIYTITLNKNFTSKKDIKKYCNNLKNKHNIIEDCTYNEIIYLTPLQ